MPQVLHMLYEWSLYYIALVNKDKNEGLNMCNTDKIKYIYIFNLSQAVVVQQISVNLR